MKKGKKPRTNLLPALEPTKDEWLRNASVLETADPTLLLELAGNPSTGRYLLGALSETAALVEPGREADLAKALRAAGQPPRDSAITRNDT